MRRTALLLVALALALATGLAAAGCGGVEEAAPTPDTVTGTVPTETEPTETTTTETEPPADGDPVAGKEVFGSSGCGACHALADAGTSGTVGPNLDDSKPSAELVVDRVANGRGAMPPFSSSLSEDQIADVAAYVSQAAGG